MLDIIFWPLGLIPWALVRIVGRLEDIVPPHLLDVFGDDDLDVIA